MPDLDGFQVVTVEFCTALWIHEGLSTPLTEYSSVRTNRTQCTPASILDSLSAVITFPAADEVVVAHLLNSD